MHFSAATCYLASLVATLVVVTTSLPQPPAGPPDVISRRKIYPNDPFNYQPPKGCLGVGATNYKHDVGGELKERDLQSPETHIGALDLRSPAMQIVPLLPCGIVVAGGQSDPFGFPDTRSVRLLWNLGGALVSAQVVRIVQVVPNGGDIVVVRAMARCFSYSNFTPVAGRLYYIYLTTAGAARQLTWFFEYPYALPVTLCSVAFANQAEQKIMTNFWSHE